MSVGSFLALKSKQGYNQRCQWYQNLPLDIPKLHAKFHYNPWCGFGEKCRQDNKDSAFHPLKSFQSIELQYKNTPKFMNSYKQKTLLSRF